GPARHRQDPLAGSRGHRAASRAARYGPPPARRGSVRVSYARRVRRFSTDPGRALVRPLTPSSGGRMSDSIESVLQAPRTFPPPESFRSRAHVKDRAEFERMYRQSLDDPDTFWGDAAKELLHWFEPWQKVLEWDEPHAQWFVGGKTNLAYNCLDLQVERGLANKVAFFWEGEPGDQRALTYGQLLEEVSRFANVLKGKGVKLGDRVAIYMPMIPEAIVAMLACARLGATHSVVFGGFSSNALSDRINDAKAEVVITAD